MTVTAIVYQKHGGPEVLEEVERPAPRLGANSVLVRVDSMGLNPLDYRLRRGEAGPLTLLNGPRLIGSDFSGAIIKVGRSVTDFKVGDEVFGMVNQILTGTSATQIAVPTHKIVHSPSNIDKSTAATVPLASLTAYQALHNLAGIRPGARVLINGASGGVGTYATQLAHIAKAHVTAVTSFRNVHWMHELGATDIIDYTKTDFAEESERYDLIFDCYGNRHFPQVRDVLRDGGLYINTIPSGRQYVHCLGNGLRSKKNKVVVVRSRPSDLRRIGSLIEDNRLRPIVDSTFSRSQIQAAYAKLETKRTKGKIALNLDQ